MTYQGLIFNVTQHAFLSRPLGGHRIAHWLREQGWDIEVVDWANWWNLEQLQEFVRMRCTKHTRFIAFSKLFNIWPDIMEQFAGWIKQNYPHVILISGSSVNPMFTSKHIDWYIQGYGEHAITALLKYCAGNGTQPHFRFQGYRKVIGAIDSYPAWPMRSLMVRYQDRDFIQSDEWLTVELARGCKFKCAFCQFPVLGVREDTTRDAADFQLQLQDAYDRFGVSDYIIADETVNDRTEKLKKFADVVETLTWQPWFSAYVRADLMATEAEQRSHMLRMNLLGHFYGIESMHTPAARSIGKGMRADRIKQTLLDNKQFFLTNGDRLYRGHVGLIAGLPFETEQTLMDTMSWLIENWQGQSFGIHHLLLPDISGPDKQSNMSLDLARYGYTEMSPQEVPNLESDFLSEVRQIQRKGQYSEINHTVNWQNDNMNIFDAQRIVHSMYQQKRNHDFRPGAFMINYRLLQPRSVQQRLAMSFDEYDSLLDEDISRYINAKLSWSV